jgi:hypothetical protein
MLQQGTHNPIQNSTTELAFIHISTNSCHDNTGSKPGHFTCEVAARPVFLSMHSSITAQQQGACGMQLGSGLIPSWWFGIK